jgi:Peptidase family M23
MPVAGLEPAGRHGHRPWPGEPQPYHPVKGRRDQGGGGSPLVNVGGRLFAPLAGLDENNVSQGGYVWLSSTDGGMTYHPGVDLNAGGSCNADLGNAVVAPLAGVVRAVLYAASGEGNHVWIEMDDACCPGPTWFHVDHLVSVACSEGQRLAPGQQFGACGATGGWDCAHLHSEFLKGPPAQGFWQWPYGWSRAQVEAAYYRPLDWWNAATGLVLAEDHRPIPPEVVMLLEDWQIKGWVLASLYEWAGIAYNPDSGTAQAWVKFLREGTYLGRPRTEERMYGEGADIGVWVEYEHGCLFYRVSDGQSSVTG